MNIKRVNKLLKTSILDVFLTQKKITLVLTTNYNHQDQLITVATLEDETGVELNYGSSDGHTMRVLSVLGDTERRAIENLVDMITSKILVPKGSMSSAGCIFVPDWRVK